MRILDLFQNLLPIWIVIELVQWNISKIKCDVVYSSIPFQERIVANYSEYLVYLYQIKSHPNLIILLFNQQSLQLIDIVNNFNLVQTYPIPVVYAYVQDQYVFVVGSDNLITVLVFNESTTSLMFHTSYSQYDNNKFISNSIEVDSNLEYMYVGSQGQLVILKFEDQNSIEFVSASTNQQTEKSQMIAKVDQFVYLSNFNSGLAIFNVADVNNPVYIRSLQIIGGISVQNYVFSREKILYSNSMYFGIQIVDISGLYANQVDFSSSDETTFLINQVTAGVVLNLFAFSEDETLFFLGVRSNGIQIYDVSTRQNKLKPVFLQMISYIGNFSNMVFMGVNMRYLIVSSSNKLVVFQQTVSSQALHLVNMFRPNLSISIRLSQDIGDSSSFYLVNSRYLVVSGGLQYQFQVVDLGLIAYSYKIIISSPFLLKEFVVNGVLKNNVLFLLRQRQYFLLANTQKIYVYDTSIPIGQNQPSFNLVYTYKISFVFQVNEIAAFSDENTLLVCYSKFIIVLDISNITNFQIIQTVYQLNQYPNDHSSIAIDLANKYGVVTILQMAAIYFTVTDDYHLEYKQFFPLYGAQSVRYDKNDGGLFFIADGISGVTILDCTDRSNPFIRTTFYLNRWIVRIFQPKNISNTLLLNELQKGSVTVIDYTNIDSIYIKQQFFELEDETYRAIIDDNTNYLMVMQTGSMRVYYLEKVAQILRENEFISEKQQSQSGIYYLNSPYNVTQGYSDLQRAYAQVGENALISFSPLKLPQEYIFSNLKIYLDPYSTQGTVPTWVILDKQNENLQITPPKELFTSQNFTVLFHIEISLHFQNTDFMTNSSDLVINSTNSMQIYSQLIEFGMLNSEGYLSQNVDPMQAFPSDLLSLWVTQYGSSLSSSLSAFVAQQMIMSTLFFPFYVNIRRSLFLTTSIELCQYNIEKECYIQSLQESISFTIQIQNNITFFVNQSYEGVLSQFYESGSLLLLQGSPQMINQILLNNLYVYSNHTDHSQKLKLTLSDKVDYDWSAEIGIDPLQFIWYKLNITNNFPIEQIYQNKYPNGLQVETSFSLELNRYQIYSYHPNLNLTFQAYFDANRAQPLPTTLSRSWIAFDGLYLFGTSALDQYKDSYTIYFYISDGYETRMDTLEIYFGIYSLKEIFKRIALVSGFVIFFLLCFLFRQQIHAILFFHHYLHQTDIIPKDVQSFSKKMQLMYTIWADAYTIFTLLKESFKENENAKIIDFDEDKEKGKYSTFYLYYQNSQGVLNEGEFINDCVQIYKKYTNKFPSLNSNVFKEKTSKIREALICIYYKYALYCDQQSLFVYNKIKYHHMKKTDGLDWYHDLIKDRKAITIQTLRSTNDNLEISSSHQESANKSLEDTNESRILFNDLSINIDDLRKSITQLSLSVLESYEVEYDLKVIQHAIKADFYGYDCNYNVKSYRQSFGESLHITDKQIGRILCYKRNLLSSKNITIKNSKKMGFFSHIVDNLNWNYKRYPIMLSKLDDQQDSEAIQYDISLDSITFKVNVDNLSQGQYKIQIYNTSKYLIFQYSFIIFTSSKLSNLQNKIKMFTFNTTNPITRKKEKEKSKFLQPPPANSIYRHSFDSSRKPLTTATKDKEKDVQSIFRNEQSGRGRSKNMAVSFDNESHLNFI